MPIVNSTTCPNCGRLVPAYASEGLCAPCLLAGVATLVDEEPPRAEAGDLVAGKMIGEYEIIERIARGGMGVVFRARERRLGRIVALKMIVGADFAGPDEVRRFRLEAEAAAHLEHPNIVPVYAVGEADGRQFFAMKFAEGGTLASRVASREPMPVREAAQLVAKVAHAVQFAHGRGVLHRDLKPANILLDADGEPLVADFGLAKFIEGGAAFTLTGTALGTPGYMAPEQADGALGEVTTVSDVYSIGAILYHALAGRQVFEGGGTMEVLRRLVAEDPKSPRAVRPELDADIEAICMKCIERQSERRYASAGALADDLEAWLAGEAVSARPASPSQRIRKWARRRPAVAASLFLGGAALVALTVVLAVATAMFRKQRDAAETMETSATQLAARVREDAVAAVRSREWARDNLYAADMFVVSTAIAEGNLGLAREALRRQVPEPGDREVRGFEWYAFQRICEGDVSRVLRDHTRAVNAVAFSPDGKTLATGGTDGTVRLAPADGVGAVRMLPPADAPVKSAEIPMMLRLASRSPELTGMLATLKIPIAEMRMYGRPSALGEISAVAWSADLRWLATASRGGYVRVWDAAALSLERILPITTGMQLAFTPDGRRLIVGAGGGMEFVGEIAIYDRATCERLHTIKPAMPRFALSANGGELFYGDGGRGIAVCDPSSGALLRRWDGVSDAREMALSPDGKLLATTEEGGAGIVFRSAASGEVRGRLNVAPDRVQSLAFTHDGRMLIAGGTGHAVRIVDGVTFQERWRLSGHEDEVLAVATAPDRAEVASGGNDHTARIWSLDAGGGARPSYAGEGVPKALAANGSAMLFLTDNGSVRRCDLSGGPVLATAPSEGRSVLGFSDGDEEFATIITNADAKPVVEFFREGAMPEAYAVPVAQQLRFAGAMSRDGRTLVMREGKDGGALFRIPGGRKLRDLGGARRSAGDYRFSPNGARVAGFSWPRRMTVWDVESGEQFARWTVSEGTVEAFAFSPDGETIASGGSDNVVSLWNARSGEMLARLRGHKASVVAMAFSPDGRTLATSGSDNVLRLWHLPTRRELGALWRGEACSFLAFSADGVRLVAGSSSGRVWWFDAPR